MKAAERFQFNPKNESSDFSDYLSCCCGCIRLCSTFPGSHTLLGQVRSFHDNWLGLRLGLGWVGWVGLGWVGLVTCVSSHSVGEPSQKIVLAVKSPYQCVNQAPIKRTNANLPHGCGISLWRQKIKIGASSGAYPSLCSSSSQDDRQYED